MSVEKLVEHFSALENPRCAGKAGKVEHRLIDILVVAVCAVLACAESWDDIALYGRNKLILPDPGQRHSHDTFRRVLADQLEKSPPQPGIRGTAARRDEDRESEGRSGSNGGRWWG
jgi:hypothetical protein